MLKVTKVPMVPRLRVGNLLCIILYFHSIMLKVTEVPRVPRLPVGNLLYITVCHRLNNAQSSQGFQVTGRQSVIVFNCYALKFPCSHPVEKKSFICVNSVLIYVSIFICFYSKFH